MPFKEVSKEAHLDFPGASTAGGTGSIGVGWGTKIAHAARPDKRNEAHFHPGTLYQLWVGSIVHGIRPHACGRSGPGLVARLETTFPGSLGGGALPF